MGSVGMLRAGILLMAATLASCAGSGPRIQAGPDAVQTPDGLFKVDGVPFGTLFMKPNYVFGSYREFVLGDAAVTFEQGSRVLDADELESLTSTFEDVAREAIEATGRKQVVSRGPCVAFVNLALVDLALDEDAGPGSVSLGAVTLVLEIRDGHTNQALLRYGQRRRLRGGSLRAAFRRYASTFQRDFERSLPRPETVEDPLSCEQRAGRG